MTPVAVPGQCRDCMRKRDVYPISRQGGGAYNRAGRTYRTSICAECVLRLVPHLYLEGSTSRYTTSTLFDIAATLPEAWPLLDGFIVARQDRRERWAVQKILRETR